MAGAHVLLASEGMTAEAIAAVVSKSLLAVRRWRRRYLAGVDGLLKDATRPSRVKPLSTEVIERVVHLNPIEQLFRSSRHICARLRPARSRPYRPPSA